MVLNVGNVGVEGRIGVEGEDKREALRSVKCVGMCESNSKP